MSDSDNSRDRILKAAFDCRSELVAYAWSLLGNLAAAEDAVQEAMLVVVKKHDQFEEGTSVLAWCRAMVRIEVLRARQLHGKERSLVERLLDDAVDAAFEEFQTTSDHHQNGLRHEALAHCFEELTDRGRRLLNARFVDQLSYPQIGDRLQMTIEAVRKALFRAKQHVKSCVETRLEAAQ